MNHFIRWFAEIGSKGATDRLFPSEEKFDENIAPFLPGGDRISRSPDTALATNAAIFPQELTLQTEDFHELEQAIGRMRD